MFRVYPSCTFRVPHEKKERGCRVKTVKKRQSGGPKRGCPLALLTV